MTCKALNALPRPGGVLDQDSFFIHMFNLYEAALDERKELDSKRAVNREKMKQQLR